MVARQQQLCKHDDGSDSQDGGEPDARQLIACLSFLRNFVFAHCSDFEVRSASRLRKCRSTHKLFMG